MTDIHNNYQTQILQGNVNRTLTATWHIHYHPPHTLPQLPHTLPPLPHTLPQLPHTLPQLPHTHTARHHTHHPEIPSPHHTYTACPLHPAMERFSDPRLAVTLHHVCGHFGPSTWGRGAPWSWQSLSPCIRWGCSVRGSGQRDCGCRYHYKNCPMKVPGTWVPCLVCWGQEECPPILWTSVKTNKTVSVISKIL